MTGGGDLVTAAPGSSTQSYEAVLMAQQSNAYCALKNNIKQYLPMLQQLWRDLFTFHFEIILQRIRSRTDDFLGESQTRIDNAKENRLKTGLKLLMHHVLQETVIHQETAYTCTQTV